MRNQLYNSLKFLTTIAMPAVLAVYLVLASTLDKSYSVRFAATIAVTNVVLTILLVVFAKKFNTDDYSGELALTTNDPDTGIPGLKLTITRDPNEFADERTLLFKSVDNR